MGKHSKNNKSFQNKNKLELCTKFWEEFIEIYRSLPEIWNVKCFEYKDRHLKRRAYETLAEKLREIDSEANVETVKRKINNLRTTYRRELRKIIQSERSGADEIYCPTLWYFDLLDFLDDRDDQEFGFSTEDIEEDASLLDEEEAPVKKTKPSRFIPKNHLYKKIIELLDSTKETPDQAKTFSATWESMYRDLDQQQQLYANRTIMETLYQASLGNLHAKSHQSLDLCQETAESRPICTKISNGSLVKNTSTPMHNDSVPLDTYKFSNVKIHPIKLISSNVSPTVVSSDEDVKNTQTKKFVAKKKRKVSRKI